MSTILQGSELRALNFGQRATKSTGTLAVSTVALFTVAGGQVAITSMYGIVTTAITVANSYSLQHNPTAGTTVPLFSATDLGTTDTVVGELLGFTGDAIGSSLSVGGAVELLRAPIALAAGQIESVSGGTDGAITWVVSWVPLDPGASLVAA